MSDLLASRLEPLHLLRHPFYQAWMAGEITRTQLKDYAEQYYHHVAAFPRYLGAIHAQCADATMRREILDNLNDEEGVTHGVSHPELWMQFAEGVGADRATVQASKPRAAIRQVMDTFFSSAHKSYHQGLGALYAYESQVPEIADSKIKGLQQHYGVTDSRTLKFFEVHKVADIHHRHTIKGLLDALPPIQREEAADAAEQAATSLWNFLSDVQGSVSCATEAKAA